MGFADFITSRIVYTANIADDAVTPAKVDETGDYTVNALTGTAEIASPKIKFTLIGGLAIKLYNRTGADTVKGQLVPPDTATADGATLTSIDDVDCIGVFLDDGVADDALAWVVVSGIADVLFDDNFGPTQGDWVETSEAGYANSAASPAAAPTHFSEIGHCIETVAAGGGGTHVLARCVLHFN